MLDLKESCAFMEETQYLHSLTPQEWMAATPYYIQEKNTIPLLTALLHHSNEVLEEYLNIIPESHWQQFSVHDFLPFRDMVKTRQVSFSWDTHFLVQEGQSWDEVRPHLNESISSSAFRALLHKNPSIVPEIPSQFWLMFADRISMYYTQLSLTTLNTIFEKRAPDSLHVNNFYENTQFRATTPQPMDGHALRYDWISYPATWLKPYCTDNSIHFEALTLSRHWCFDAFYDKIELLPRILGHDIVWQTLAHSNTLGDIWSHPNGRSVEINRLLFTMLAFLSMQYHDALPLLYPDVQQDIDEVLKTNISAESFFHKYHDIPLHPLGYCYSEMELNLS